MRARSVTTSTSASMRRTSGACSYRWCCGKHSMFQPLPPPAKTWAIDVLTTDFLISGHIDVDRNRLAFHLIGGDYSSIVVSSARIRPTGNLAMQSPASSQRGTPDALAAQWTVAYGDTV